MDPQLRCAESGSPVGKAATADRVLHFGPDICNRLLVLRGVGYVVDDCLSVKEFGSALQESADHRVILLAESSKKERRDALAIARSLSLAPIILFDNLNTGESEKDFDLVIPPLTRPEEWLEQVAARIAEFRTLLANSAEMPERSLLLRRRCETLRQKSVSERRRSAQERARIEKTIRDIQGNGSSEES
jgi:hypothetical protein